MAGLTKNQPSHWWWLDTHSPTKRSPWLQATLAELNEKTGAMLKLIEEDADSFARRAEMYYRKRPELIRMVEDFYRTHRSLAERYDQVKPDSGIRLLMTGGSPFASAKYQSESPFSSAKYQIEKLMSFTDRSYDSYSENCYGEESAESEVDDPEHEDETKFDNGKKEEEVPFTAASEEVIRLREEIERLREENRIRTKELEQKNTMNDEVMRMRREIERLREENKAQKDQLKTEDAMNEKVMMLKKEIEGLKEENRAQMDQLELKDEEKIEVIRHLSVAIDMLKQENVKMKNFIVKESSKKWKNPFELNKLKEALSGKLFNGTSRNQPTVVAL